MATAAAKYDMGTPIRGERKHRRMHSPLQEMDGLDDGEDDAIRTLEFEEPALPMTSPGGQTGITIEAITSAMESMLEKKQPEKLDPVTKAVKEEVGALSSKVKLVEEGLGALKGEMQELKGPGLSKAVETVLTAEFGHLGNNGMDDVYSKMEDIQKQLDDLSVHGPPTKSGGIALFGGFADESKDEAEAWITKTKASRFRTSQPNELFHKGDDFKSIMFAGFDSEGTVTKITDKFQRQQFKIGNSTISCKPDRPIHIRVPLSFLFRLRWQLNHWGFTKQEVKVNDNDMVMKNTENNI